jgi:hypothetical protein
MAGGLILSPLHSHANLTICGMCDRAATAKAELYAQDVHDSDMLYVCDSCAGGARANGYVVTGYGTGQIRRDQLCHRPTAMGGKMTITDTIPSSRGHLESMSDRGYHYDQAARLIETIKSESLAQWTDQAQLLALKQERERTKLEILISGSQSDPKALGANEALRSAEVDRRYYEYEHGRDRDGVIAEMEQAVAMRQIDIDHARRMLRLHEAMIGAHDERL